MIVVADTGPLNYLILIEHIGVLQRLYGDVIIPPAVQDELLASQAPDRVKLWIANPPGWLEVRTPGRILSSLHPRLDQGEREAITLAQNTPAGSLLLIDELRGRREASRIGLDIIGTLGVLFLAHERELLDFKEAVERLRITTFNMSDALLRRFLQRL